MIEIIVPIIAGIFGGIVRFILGWAKNEEWIDWKKALKSIVRATIGGALFGYYFILPTGIDIFSAALLIIFSAITIDVLWHDTYKTIKG